MHIKFKSEISIDPKNLGVNFCAECDEKFFVINVSTEALQDVNPELKSESTERQFNINRRIFEQIAHKKILENPASDRISITSADVPLN